MEGFLKKRNTKKESKFMQNWNKRWFELSGQTLTYAKTAKDITAGTVQVYAVADIERVDRKGDKEFELVIPERTLLLKAKDEPEMNRWIEAINDTRKTLGCYRSPQASPTSPLEAGGRHVQSWEADDAAPAAPAGRGRVALPDFSEHAEEAPPHQQGGPPSPRTLLARPDMAAQAFGTFYGDGQVEGPHGGGGGGAGWGHGGGHHDHLEEVQAFSDGEESGDDSGEDYDPPPQHRAPPAPPPRRAPLAEAGPPPQGAYARAPAPVLSHVGQLPPPPPAPVRVEPEAPRSWGGEHHVASARVEEERVVISPPREKPALAAPPPAVAAVAVDENWLEEDWDSGSEGGEQSPLARGGSGGGKHPAATGKASRASAAAAGAVDAGMGVAAVHGPGREKFPPPPRFAPTPDLGQDRGTPTPPLASEMTDIQPVDAGCGRSSTPTATGVAPRAPPPSEQQNAGTGAFGAVEPDRDWLEEDWDSSDDEGQQ